jgi:DNA-directed RNA polymerase beta' subunit
MEVRHLFNVESIYLTPQSHRAGIGLIQNGLLLAYLISCKDVMLSAEQKAMLESACHYGVRDENMLAAFESPKGKLWTGKQVFSQTFSPRLDLSKTADFPASKIEVSFDRGHPWPEWVKAIMHPSESVIVI